MMYIIMQLLTPERCVFKVLPDVTARHCSSSALEKLKPRRGAGHSFHKPGPGRPALGSAEHAALIHHTGRNHPHFMAHQKLKHLENPFITNRYRSAWSPHIPGTTHTPHNRLSHDCSHGDIRDKGLGFILLRHYRKVSSQPSSREVLCWECAEWGCSNQAAVKMAVKTMLAADKIRRLQGTVAAQIGSVRTCSTADTYTGLLLVRILQAHWPPIGHHYADTGLLLVNILCPHSRYIVII